MDIAVSGLSPYKKIEKRKQNNRAVSDFHGIHIILRITSPVAFEESPYYVDYQNTATIPNAPFVTCMVRESKSCSCCCRCANRHQTVERQQLRGKAPESASYFENGRTG